MSNSYISFMPTIEFRSQSKIVVESLKLLIITIVNSTRLIPVTILTVLCFFLTDLVPTLLMYLQTL